MEKIERMHWLYGLDPGEYAEYLVGKAAECTDRLRHIWG